MYSNLYGLPDGASPESYVGIYSIYDTIGEGSFSKVKLALNRRTNKRVAIKIMNKADIKALAFTRQVKREIQIMSKLSHPNVISLHEVMRSDTKLYIVMELVDGGELFSILGRLGDENEAKNYFKQIVNGVHYCHEKGIAHRDLKAENVLLERNGNVKIADFGFSSFVGIDSETGLLYTQCGTPEYCAPEIIDGGSSKGYDGMKADCWSLGIILYAMLCGRLPFLADNTEALFSLILESNIPQYPRYLSNEARDLLDNLMRTDPSKRYDIYKVKRHSWLNTSSKYVNLRRRKQVEIPKSYRNADSLEDKLDQSKNKITQALDSINTEEEAFQQKQAQSSLHDHKIFSSSKISRNRHYSSEYEGPSFPKTLPRERRNKNFKTYNASRYQEGHKKETINSRRSTENNNTANISNPHGIEKRLFEDSIPVIVNNGEKYPTELYGNVGSDLIEERERPTLRIPSHILKRNDIKAVSVREEAIDGPSSVPVDAFQFGDQFIRPESPVSYPYGEFPKKYEIKEAKMENWPAKYPFLNVRNGNCNIEFNQKYSSHYIAQRLWNAMSCILNNDYCVSNSGHRKLPIRLRDEFNSIMDQFDRLNTDSAKVMVLDSLLSLFKESMSSKYRGEGWEESRGTSEAAYMDPKSEFTPIFSNENEQKFKNDPKRFENDDSLKTQTDGIEDKKSIQVTRGISNGNLPYNINRPEVMGDEMEFISGFNFHYEGNVDFERLKKMAVGEEC